MNTHDQHLRIFRAFSDAKRLHILELLRSGEKCACVIQEHLGLGQSGLSYHMKILVESGIIESRQDGKWTYYQISAAGSAQAEKILREITSLNKDATTSKTISC